MTERYTYDAFGKRIHSEVELPWLVESPRGTASRPGTPPVTVTLDSLPETPNSLPAEFSSVDRHEGYRVFLRDRTCFWFHDSGRTVRVQDGTDIAVSPSHGDGPKAVRRSIIGPGLRTICHQRGQLALHATVVVLGSTTVAFVGRSGRGKSTAAAACVARGHDLLADDLAAVDVVDGTAIVESGHPTITLDATAARELGLVPDTSDWESRRPVDVSGRFYADPRALDLVYLVKDGAPFDVEDLPSSRRALTLLKASLSPYRDSDRAALGEHLDSCANVSSSVPVRRLTRPRTYSRLDELVTVVEEDAADSTTGG